MAIHYATTKADNQNDEGATAWSNSTNIDTPTNAGTAFLRATAGDTVYFRGGTYNIMGTSSWYIPDLQPANSGTFGSPINFEGYQNETAIFAADNANSPVFGTYVTRSYINFKKFTVDTSGVSPGNIRNAFKFSSGGTYNSNITVENCIVIGHSIPITDHHAGIAISESDVIIIKNNKIYGWISEDTSGISLWGNLNCIIEHNEIYNCYRGIDNVGVNTNHVYCYNYIYSLTEKAMRFYYQSGGITNCQIYQNLMRSCGGGIGFIAEGHGNNLIYNNTLYQVGYIGPTGNVGSEIFNNIIWNNKVGDEDSCYIWHTGTEDPDLINYNLYWYNSLRFGYRIYGGGSYYTSMPWPGSEVYDGNSKNSNPDFVNAGSGLATGFKLNAGSPALTGGRGGSYATVMGAYITGNEEIGIEDEGSASPQRTLFRP